MHRVLMRPDYNAGHCFGGKIEDYPDRSLRYFNDKRRKRSVTFSILTWRGFDPSAQHYYVYFREEDNPFWDDEEKFWRTCWKEDEGKGRTGRIEVLTTDAAIRCLERLKNWVFPNHKHVIDTSVISYKRKRPSKLASGD